MLFLSSIRQLLVTGLLLVSLPLCADTLTLNNGDTLSAEIVSETDEAIVINHPDLGQITIPRDRISAVLPSAELEKVIAEAPVADPSPAPEPEQAPSRDNGLLNTGWLMDWQRKLELGISGAAGKSDNNKMNLAFTADYEDEQKRWAHKTSYYRNESDGELSDHSFLSSIKRDWLVPDEKYFYYAQGQLDIDEFKDWDYRLSGGGGLGYEFIETDSLRVLGRVGLGANQTFGGTREETTYEGAIGGEVKWKISPDQEFSFSNYLLPNFSDTGEYRNQTAADWSLALNDMGLGLKIGFSNEYDSLSSEADKNDFKYALSLTLGL